jgi:hypothetical protein
MTVVFISIKGEWRLRSLKNKEFDAKAQRCKGLKEKGDKNEKRWLSICQNGVHRLVNNL